MARELNLVGVIGNGDVINIFNNVNKLSLSIDCPKECGYIRIYSDYKIKLGDLLISNTTISIEKEEEENFGYIDFNKHYDITNIGIKGRTVGKNMTNEELKNTKKSEKQKWATAYLQCLSIDYNTLHRIDLRNLEDALIIVLEMLGIEKWRTKEWEND